MSDNQAVSKITISPRFFRDATPTNTGPVSIRSYKTIEEVNLARLEQAAAMTDAKENNTIMSPIGGVISLTVGDYLDDVMAVPPAITLNEGPSILGMNQIPLMIDTKPPAEPDPEKEVDCGRIPTIDDLISSAKGQEKPQEMVLAVPTEELLRALLVGQSDHIGPAEVTESVFNNLTFVRRDWCETDTRFIQFLPYVYYWKQTTGGIEIFTYQRGKESGEGRLALDCSIGTGGHVNPLDFFSKIEHEVARDTYEETQIHGRKGQRILADGFWSGIVNSVLREGNEEVFMTRGPDNHVVELLDHINNDIQINHEGKMSMEEWVKRRTVFFLDYKANAVEKAHLGMFIGIEVPADYEITTAENVLVDVGFRSIDVLYHDQFQKTLPSRLECWSRSLIESIYETISFVKENPPKIHHSERFYYNALMRSGNHPRRAEEIETIPAGDRWKLGTLSSSMSHELAFYAMNLFVRA